LLLLRSGDAVLLERRPGTGLWGGLWSLPEFAAPTRGALPAAADAGALAAWAGARFGLPIGEPAVLQAFRHTFTHFRLHARVWKAEVAIGLPAPEGHEWLALADAAGAPLPRPIKTLLVSLPAQAGR
jgi:A/G-specific adenine glycosylase